MPEPRLLVIDDDVGLCELFDLFMRKEGFNVATADDGVLGLAKVDVFRPHLIVLDLMMPNLDGFQVLRKLQASGMANIPVIIVTGYSNEASAEVVRREPNVVNFFTKPLKYKELAESIRGVLAGRKLE
jgi:DNA-binding response OmpR family regulator